MTIRSILMPARKTSRKYKVFWLIYWTASFVYLLLSRDAFLHYGGQERAIFAGLLAAIVLTGFLTFRFMSGLKQKDEKGHEVPKPFRLPQILMIIGNAFFCYWILEMVNNPSYKEIQVRYLLLNIAGILIMTVIFLCWLNSWRRSLIAMLSLYSVMTVIFYVVMSMRGEPFQFIDIFSLGTALGVANKYELTVSWKLPTAIVLSLCLMGFYLHLPDAAPVRKGKIKKLILRAAVFASMFAMYWFYLNVNWNGGAGILTDLFSPQKTYTKYGTTVGFFCVAKYMRLTPPEGYSPGRAEKIAKKSEAEKEEPQASEEKPVNVIAIMNESWADYRYAGSLQTSRPVMPFYDSMKENTVKGHTMVCIYGGGTAKTEYEFLTGNSVKRFPAMVPYVSYFTHNQYSIVSAMKEQGFRTIAMHPYRAANWNRPTAYRLLGFDQFLSEEDFPKNAERIRGLISDQADYDKIIDLVEHKKNKDDRLFLFNVTMQNHGGYETFGYDGNISVTGYENRTVRNFLSLERESDDALRNLIGYFSKSDQKTIILMFGDHYPDMPEDFEIHLSGKKKSELPLEQKQRYYSTPFFIWANYDIPEQDNVLTSTNYLSAWLLENTGWKMTPYQQYIRRQREKIPALNHLGYLDRNGTWHSWSAASKDDAETENEYEILQYNELAEKNKRIRNFFTLP